MSDDGKAFMKLKLEGTDKFFRIDELSLPDDGDGLETGKEMLEVAAFISREGGASFLVAESVVPEDESPYSGFRPGSSEDYITNMYKASGFIEAKHTENGLLMIKYLEEDGNSSL